MNMMGIVKSKFDSGNWSKVNGLPGQDDMINYLHHLLKIAPNKCFSRRDLMQAMTDEFEIPPEKAKAECPNCDTPALYTRLTYLICDGINGVRKADEVFMKRVGLNLYQYINGNRSTLQRPNKTIRQKISRKFVGEAKVSVKILRDLKHVPEQIILELAGKWDDNVIEAAINEVFAVDILGEPSTISI